MKRWLLLAILGIVVSAGLGEPLRRQYKLIERYPIPPNVKFFRNWGMGLAPAAAMGYWLKFLSTVGGWMIEERMITRDRVISRIFRNPERLRWMDAYLQGIVELAPLFPEPYLYAGIMFYWFGLDEEKAVAFLKKAHAAGIKKWEVPFYIGVYRFRSNHLQESAEWLKRATEYPDIPAVVPLTFAMVTAKAGKPEASLEVLDLLLANLPPKMVVFRRLLETDRKVQEKLLAINQAIQAYRQAHGALPSDLNELTKRGFLQADVLEVPTRGKFLLQGDHATFEYQLEP